MDKLRANIDLHPDPVAGWSVAFGGSPSLTPVDFRSLTPEFTARDRSTHLLHPYPAKLIPEIPHLFLRSGLVTKSTRRLLVADPFCGSGTVLVEGVLAGYDAVGADTNPLARLIARVKTRPIASVRINRSLANVCRWVAISEEAEAPPVVNIRYWYSRRIITELSKLRAAKDVFSRAGWKGLFRRKIRDPSIDYYVFIDDLCGSGTQAEQYARKILRPLKRIKPDAKAYYFPLVATEIGLNEVRKLNWFDEVAAVVELDDSFKCFSDTSRIYKNEQLPFDRIKARSIAARYGSALWQTNPLGWKEGQLLLGFEHNTPDNTLPIMWFAEQGSNPFLCTNAVDV